MKILPFTATIAAGLFVAYAESSWADEEAWYPYRETAKEHARHYNPRIQQIVVTPNQTNNGSSYWNQTTGETGFISPDNNGGYTKWRLSK